VFTDSRNSAGRKLRAFQEYVVSPHVRVRKEEFGLLFYNTQNAKLTFVGSGDLFRIENLPKGRKKISAACEAVSRCNLKIVLRNLANKGLIFEA
jgi:putative mycofactocin binding protein MftB